MKAIRERDSTRRVYPEDPFCEVYAFRDNMNGILTLSADGAGDPWMYLIVGEQKAMLIDTGFGIGNLRGLCDKLTGGKELIVANTHAHVDHAGGNFQFEKVYCHEFDAPQLVHQMLPGRWDPLFDGEGNGIYASCKKTDVIPFRPYEVAGVENGYTFDLGGGHEIELIHTAGHSSGHAAFLDKKNRNLIAGDDIISMRVSVGGPRPGDAHGKYATIQAYRKCMAALAARTAEFDHIFTGHFITDIENSVVQNIVDALDDILADPEHSWDMKRPDRRGNMQMHKFVRGLGTIAYTANSFRDDSEDYVK